MPTTAEILSELKRLGTEQTRKTFLRHGAPDETFGVKIGDLKVVAKKIKGNQDLALKLYESGNSDAMYLAGMVANGSLMSKQQLEAWAKRATWHMLAEYTVPGVATESEHARELALKWIKAKKELIASCGWSTYSGLVATRADEALDLAEIQGLLDHVVEHIHDSPNKVRYTMNCFVIAVGTYVEPLLKKAKQAARKIGKVEVDMGDTACKVPLALEYIEMVEKMGRVGKKRKTMKC